MTDTNKICTLGFAATPSTISKFLQTFSKLKGREYTLFSKATVETFCNFTKDRWTVYIWHNLNWSLRKEELSFLYEFVHRNDYDLELSFCRAGSELGDVEFVEKGDNLNIFATRYKRNPQGEYTHEISFTRYC